MLVATWTLIGIVIAGGIGFVVDARQGRRDLGTELKGAIRDLDSKIDGKIDGLDSKIDGLRTELKGDFSDLRRSVEAQTARVDDLVKDVGKLNGAVDSLGTRIGHLEGNRV